MKKSAIAWAALLALALTSCGNAPSKTPETEPETTLAKQQTETQPQQAIGKGTVSMLDKSDGDTYYHAFQDWEIGKESASNSAIIYSIDMNSGEAHPVCRKTGCSHDTDSCPAFYDVATNVETFSNEKELYAAVFHYADEQNYYTLEKINADRTERQVMLELPNDMGLVSTALAQDEENLYFMAYRDMYENGMQEFLYAVNRNTFDFKEIYRWDELSPADEWGSPEIVYMAGAAERQLYFIREMWSQYGKAQVVVGALDLETGAYTELQCYERDGGTVIVPPNEENRGYASFAHEYRWYYNDRACAIAEYNSQEGTVSVIDPITGQKTELATGLPTSCEGRETGYSVVGYRDGWLLNVYEFGRDAKGNGTGEYSRHQYFCKGDKMTEISQECYIPGKDIEKIAIENIRNGNVLVAYDGKSRNVQTIDESGATVTQQVNWRIYGVIPLSELLNGSADYTPLAFTQ